MAKKAARLPKRPYPPQDLGRMIPAAGVGEWVAQEILSEAGALHNSEHHHLLGADLEFLWAPEGFRKQMRSVIGTAEEVTIRAGGWQKARQEQQMVDWFGRVPGYLITLDASYCTECGDAEFCALVEHELYHLAHKLDDFGVPMFSKSGAPKLCIRGHDVEEFIGVVRRYGVGDPSGAIAQLARAASHRPEINLASIAGACGTCLLRAA